MHAVGLIERAAIHLDAEIPTGGKRKPGADPQQQQADGASGQCGHGKRNISEGQHQVSSRRNAPSLRHIRDDRVAEHPIGCSEYADEGQHGTQANNFRESADQHQDQ